MFLLEIIKKQLLRCSLTTKRTPYEIVFEQRQIILQHVNLCADQNGIIVKEGSLQSWTKVNGTTTKNGIVLAATSN